MRKITTLVILLIFATGFSQEQGITFNATESPITSPLPTNNNLDECGYEHILVAGPYGGQGTSIDSAFKSAVDISVPAGEDFTLNEILIPIMTFAPMDRPLIAVIKYYTDNEGIPGDVIGTETANAVVLSTEPWADPDLFKFETQFIITPFTFEGDMDNATTNCFLGIYWRRRNWGEPYDYS